ncbi:hypothetical protein [Fructilactobacillus florum]|uniref:hypothetical protein n=1 Tax=Fructilactobacillus florum TaxID=640331 RepID=UPI0006CF6976|nr:hypothetical protein [Fructilactobacillus florum]
MKKQQIAFVCNIDPGGITTVISHLAASQSIKKEFELSLFVFKKSSYHSKVQQLKKQMAVDNQGTTTLIKNVFRLTSFFTILSRRSGRFPRSITNFNCPNH